MEHNDIIAYKEWLENLSEPAPEGAWNSIADELDISDAWNGISETLDLDEVWQNIEAELPAGVTGSGSSLGKFPKLFWVAAALVLITLTTPIADPEKGRPAASLSPIAERIDSSDNTDNSYNNRAEQPEQVQTPVDKQKDAGNPAPQKPVKHSASGNVISQSKQTSEHSLILVDTAEQEEDHSTLVTDDQSVANLKAHSLTRKSVAEFIVPDSVVKLTVPDSVQVATAQPLKDTIVRKEQPRRPRWDVGIIGSIKNTWLINPETTSGLKRSSLNDTQITFGKEFGITVQRSLGRKSAVQFEYYFFSEIGQRYHEYINALYQTKDIKLHYQKVQFVYRRKVFEKLSAPALYAVAGLRVSRLTLADASIGGEEEVVTQEYRPWDYGFILGSEAEFELSKKIILVTGLRASYGVRNIYLGNGQSPAEFNKTHTASVGLSIGAKYRIN